ncbi:hypothetical protein GGI25_004760 [Coemansia spiralis]|uniref:Uncharacterized protein n=2 Tax=Coemansia TaxID=4863 RepID=A0A9W8G4G1_9FUNG|nr:hypothetical protein BX070DRAFT_227208 [Coemansia spiralis]KAJ1986776.1 hypothetical protein EDC05_006166 [Coemansia umbellata]KAJ2618555.1 hypothetical protein GGI26_006503 [Coemansia sp. RSA 1358]KAJ2673241.1 hypothetical protein GGI25_004760 [Coemansia spiralis]
MISRIARQSSSSLAKGKSFRPAAQSPLRRFLQTSRPQLEDIGLFKAYGKPVATLFLWSTLTYMSLQAIWSKLYFDEVRLETEAKIDDLKKELDELETIRAA